MELLLIKQVSFIASVSISSILYSQEKNAFDFKKIEDNSFLLEEAYNQESGVIQHCSAFQYMKNKTWNYMFTEEWPLPRREHQLSISIPIMYITNSGLGDIALNYRHQAILSHRLAFAPRATLLIPVGDYKKGLGTGVLGYQFNLPFSFLVSKAMVTHYNLGTTYIPGAKTADGSKSDIISFNYGASLILFNTENFNIMFELAGTSTTIKPSNGSKFTDYTFFINPGFRYALNCKSGLQIVPGLAIPIGIAPSKGEYGVFAYLSFEHHL